MQAESQGQLHALDVEFKAALENVQAYQSELAEERQKRIDSQILLEDFKRESSQPFVVPKLLDLFLEYSRFAVDLDPESRGQ
jgi:hypothetical protein